MPTFHYTAKNEVGKTVKGAVEARSVDVAADLLRERNLIVISLAERAQADRLEQIDNFLNRVGPKDVTFFARQLAVLIDATIPVVRALRILGKQTKNTHFKRVIADVSAEVDNGSKLSQAMSKHPKVFDQFFVHMIRAGETTGRLDKVLEYLADQKEKDYELRSRIRGAMMYPAFVVTVMILIGIGMMIFVVPRLTGIITQSGGEIPLATQVLLFTSNLFVNYWWLLLFLLGLAIVGYTLYVRTPQGRYVVDLFKLRIPVLGPLYQRVAMARFAISFSNLLSSGVPVTKALDIVGDIVGNAVYRDLLSRTIVQVEGGNPIAAEFTTEATIPGIVPQMISVGEETGKLDLILKKLSRFYTKEVESAVAALTSIIEPLIIVVLGLGGLVMVAGILLPIYNVTAGLS